MVAVGITLGIVGIRVMLLLRARLLTGLLIARAAAIATLTITAVVMGMVVGMGVMAVVVRG